MVGNAEDYSFLTNLTHPLCTYDGPGSIVGSLNEMNFVSVKFECKRINEMHDIWLIYHIPQNMHIFLDYSLRFRNWKLTWITNASCHYNDVIMSAMASQITNLTIVHSTIYSRRRSKKTSKLRVTGLCEGKSPVTGEFPAQKASNADNVSIWWRHHAIPKVVIEVSYLIMRSYLLYWHYSDDTMSAMASQITDVSIVCSTVLSVIKWKHFWRYWPFARIPLRKASDAGLWCFVWFAPEQTTESNNRDAGEVIWDTVVVITTSL